MHHRKSSKSISMKFCTEDQTNWWIDFPPLLLFHGQKSSRRIYAAYKSRCVSHACSRNFAIINDKSYDEYRKSGLIEILGAWNLLWDWRDLQSGLDEHTITWYEIGDNKSNKIGTISPAVVFSFLFLFIHTTNASHSYVSRFSLYIVSHRYRIFFALCKKFTLFIIKNRRNVPFPFFLFRYTVDW